MQKNIEKLRTSFVQLVPQN